MMWMIRDNNGSMSSTANYGDYLSVPEKCNHEAEPSMTIQGYTTITPGDLLGFNDALVRMGPLIAALDGTPFTFAYYAGKTRSTWTKPVELLNSPCNHVMHITSRRVSLPIQCYYLQQPVRRHT